MLFFNQENFSLCFWNHLTINQSHSHFLDRWRMSPKFLIKMNPLLRKCMLFMIRKFYIRTIESTCYKIPNLVLKFKNKFQNLSVHISNSSPFHSPYFFLSIKPQILTSGRSVSPAPSFVTFSLSKNKTVYTLNINHHFMCTDISVIPYILSNL